MITILILIVLGILTTDGQCQSNNDPIKNCCCLGYNSNNFNANSSGVYTVGQYYDGLYSYTRVYCDTGSGGGGWTVIQRRRDGSVDFRNRDWVNYEDGFGNLDGEFWIGLRLMYYLTSNREYELRIDYRLKNGTESYLHYNIFAVRSPEYQYRLSISGFDSIGLTDPFNITSEDNGIKFTSRDRDNDYSIGNCAKSNGGWWHHSCTSIRVNSDYKDIFMLLNNEYLFPAFVEMKIRPKRCHC